jgi:hypothetical protein
MKTLAPLVLGALLGVAAVYIESRLDPSTRRAALDAVPSLSQPALAPVTPSGPSARTSPAANLELTPEQHALADDPEAVLDRLSQVSPAASRRKLALAVLDALGNSDATIARVASRLPAQDRMSFRIDALALRADTDAAGAIRSAVAFETSAARQLALARLAEVTTSRDASIALAQVVLIDDPELKTAYLAQVAGTWASLEPEAALAWLEANVPATLSADAAAAALDAIAASDAHLLLENLGRFSAALQPLARKSALVALVAQDPQAAIAELALVGPGNDRNTLERAFGETYALENPKAALEWAQTLADSRRALEGVFRGAAFVDYEAAVNLAMNTFVAGRAQAVNANSTPIIVSINGLMDSNAGDFGKVMDGLLAADFPERTDTINTMLVRWPQLDGAAALDWALDNDNLTRIDRSLNTFPAGNAARVSPELAVAALDRVPSAFHDDWVRSIGAGMAVVDIDGALAFLDARRDEPGYLPAMGFVAERLGATDPAAGAAILARFDDPAVGNHTLAFVSSWARHDPARRREVGFEHRGPATADGRRTRRREVLGERRSRRNARLAARSVGRRPS